MKVTFLVFVLALCIINLSFAHEGHDKTPGAVTAPHGGVIQGTKQFYLELVNDASGLKLYPLSHELKPIQLKDISLTATMKLPKKAKKEKVEFTMEDDHYLATVDAKGAYRYTLEITSTFSKKKEKVKFQVEPKN